MKEAKNKSFWSAKKGLFITLVGFISVMIITLSMNLIMKKEMGRMLETEVWNETITEAENDAVEDYTMDAEAVNGTIAEEVASENTGVEEDTNTEEPQEEQEEQKSSEVIPKAILMEKPVLGEISKEFSGEELVYSKTMEDWRVHEGIDFKAKISEDVMAVADGTVEGLSGDGMLGVCLVISHPDGVQTIYGNLEEGSVPEVGTQVKTGQVIGRVGNTAVAEINEESHIHFEVRKDGKAENPHDYFGDAVEKVE